MGMDVSEEVNMLNKINHSNLIKHQGVCEYHGCFYLVFEYMSNSSLREWLCKRSSNETGSWARRIQMALDVHYLHSFTEPAYVHRNVKRSNVLLDRNLGAKIANFSPARTAAKGTKGTTVITDTRGYLAPENLETGLVTPEIDVYAFGVVILESVTGKDPVIEHEDCKVLLSAAIASIAERENAKMKFGLFIDPSIAENGGIMYALRMVKLSLTCLKEDPGSRPSMEEVVSALFKLQVNLWNSGSLYTDFASARD